MPFLKFKSLYRVLMLLLCISLLFAAVSTVYDEVEEPIPVSSSKAAFSYSIQFDQHAGQDLNDAQLSIPNLRYALIPSLASFLSLPASYRPPFIPLLLRPPKFLT
jgi:hypothetical protein